MALYEAESAIESESLKWCWGAGVCGVMSVPANTFLGFLGLTVLVTPISISCSSQSIQLSRFSYHGKHAF